MSTIDTNTIADHAGQVSGRWSPSTLWGLRWVQAPFSLSLLSGLLLCAALPRWGWWPLAWISPLGWLLLIRRDRLGGRHAYLQLWIAGLIHSLLLLYFIRLPHWTLWIGWLALSAYVGAYIPIFIGLTRVAVHQLRISLVLSAPMIWVGLELVRGHFLSGFSMALLGHTLAGLPWIIQIADLAGAYTVSFLLMFVAACLVRSRLVEREHRVWWPLLLALTALTAALGYGSWRLSQTTVGVKDSRVARVALIQGSIDTVFELSVEEADRHRVESFQQYRDLTSKALTTHEDLDLIVWPESKFPVPEIMELEGSGIQADLDPQTMQHVQRMKSEFMPVVRAAMGPSANRLPSGLQLLVGAHAMRFQADAQQHFNAALFVHPQEGIVGRYFKMHRVPFGEYILFDELFPWIYQWTPLPGAVTAGTQPLAHQVAGLNMAPNICFESTVPHLIRRQIHQLGLAGRRPDVLVNITDDGWFWGSSCLDHHLACTTMRAVENRIPILVAANTGFSAWIDGNGRVLQRGPRRATGVILAEVRPDARQSLYAKVGDWPATGCLALGILCLLAGSLRKWTSRNGSPASGR